MAFSNKICNSRDHGKALFKGRFGEKLTEVRVVTQVKDDKKRFIVSGPWGMREVDRDELQNLSVVVPVQARDCWVTFDAKALRDLSLPGDGGSILWGYTSAKAAYDRDPEKLAVRIELPQGPPSPFYKPFADGPDNTHLTALLTPIQPLPLWTRPTAMP